MLLVLLVALAAPSCSGLNLAPFFTADMNQHTLKENTPVGTVVYRLDGIDPEGSEVRFGMEGTEAFEVDAKSGEVTVAQVIDREMLGSGEIRLTVTIRDMVEEEEGEESSPSGSTPNVVKVPISVIVLDENDNVPEFSGTPYETNVSEDTPVGTTVFRAIEVTDKDLVGEVLEVECVRPESDVGEDGLSPCDFFDIVPRPAETDHDMFRGSLVLRRGLDYRSRRLLRLPLSARDGAHSARATLTVRVGDVQDRPPEFEAGASLTGVVSEDAAIGSEVLTVRARDGDEGSPRRVIYSMEENPGDFFSVDINTGAVTVDKQLDRESVAATSGVLKLKVS